MLDGGREHAVGRQLLGRSVLQPVVHTVGGSGSGGKANDVFAVVNLVGGRSIGHAIVHISDSLAEALGRNGGGGTRHGERRSRGRNDFAHGSSGIVGHAGTKLHSAGCHREVRSSKFQIDGAISRELNSDCIAKASANLVHVDAGSKLGCLYLVGLIINVTSSRIGHDHIASTLGKQVPIVKLDHAFLLVLCVGSWG